MCVPDINLFFRISRVIVCRPNHNIMDYKQRQETDQSHLQRTQCISSIWYLIGLHHR